jgi:hypothetical protein
MIQPERLHWSDHGSPTTTRDQHRLLANLPRQRPRERMLQQLENSLHVPRE